MTNYIIGIIGTWILGDACYSLMLYLTAPGHSGAQQTWARDHFVRVIRGLLGIALMVIGAIR